MTSLPVVVTSSARRYIPVRHGGVDGVRQPQTATLLPPPAGSVTDMKGSDAS